MNNLVLLPFQKKHIKKTWIWRNDPITIKMSLSRKGVSLSEHISWCKKIMNSKENFLFVCEEFNSPVAVVRFDQNIENHNTYILTINVDPKKRGKGYGRIALKRSIDLLKKKDKDCNLIVAKIRKCNFSSIKLFEFCGFHKISIKDNIYSYIFEVKQD
ncbi:GNAT family N-acetyltransferase [Prochlorococcus sp. AH-716-M10]|nr:GNAT family N-acetyltransferase [Prochlorococcus sp. AH-716-M10]